MTLRALRPGALLLLLAAAPAAAQDSPERARLDEIAREAARQFVEARAERAAETPDQTRPTTPPPPAGTRVELTLDGAVERALERNLDIAVERLNPQTFDFSIAALESNYQPTFNSNFGLRSQSQFPRSQTAGADMLVTETLTGNSGISQNMKFGGGSYSVTFNNNRQAQSDAFATRNPAINSNFTATYVQPLLRSFRIDGTRAQLQITRLNQEMSETQLRATIVRTLANVRNAYWDLVYAIQAAEVAERSLALATKLVEDNQARVEVGTLAPLDVVQAQAEQANRRQAVAQTTAATRTAELALKRLIVSGTEDPLWVSTVEPVDRPTFSSETIDVAAAVRRALGNRTDLEQSRRTLQANNIALRNLADQQLPSLDLTASYGAAGVGGPQLVRGNQLGSPVTSIIPSGYADALSILLDRDAPTWNLALNFSYPIGSSSAEANLARARLQQRQTIAQERQMELAIATEVTNAALQVEASRERWQAATAARELAELRTEAEQSRFDVGLSTNFFVVQAQRDLAEAEINELRARLDFEQSRVQFERVQQTSLESSGISVVSPAGTLNPPRVAP